METIEETIVEIRKIYLLTKVPLKFECVTK